MSVSEISAPSHSCEGRKPGNVHWIPTFVGMRGRGRNEINTFKNLQI